MDVCRKGFLVGCKPVIVVDGCHLKVGYGGQLLVAVGKDENEDLFPIAYVVVEAKYKDSWYWFFKVLENDVGPFDYWSYMFMFDQQKVKFLQIIAFTNLWGVVDIFY